MFWLLLQLQIDDNNQENDTGISNMNKPVENNDQDTVDNVKDAFTMLGNT